MQAFEYSNPTRVLFGPGRSQMLAEDLPALAAPSQRTLVVSDPGIVAAGLADALADVIAKAGGAVQIFSDVQSNPHAASVDGAAALIRRQGFDAIIGLGGGSAMDVAKLAAVVASGSRPCADYALGAQPLPPKAAPTVMLPTTAGTGTEVTRTAVISDAAGRKLWYWGDVLAPDAALLDPHLTLGLPTALTAATGLDALVHAIEACTHANSNPFVAAVGLQAVRLVARSLRLAVRRPDDLIARGDLLVAAALAGMAIDGSGCGIAHAMGHALSTLAGLHHGRAVALVLKAAFCWNAETAGSVYAEIARALGVNDRGQGDAALAQAGCERYERLMEDIGLSTDLAADGLGAEDVQRLVEATLSPENRVMCQANCRVPSDEDLHHLARQVLNAV